jgi:hypothetical protein
MAKQDDDSAATSGSGAAGSTAESMENRMLAFAEQLGRIVGTVQAKAEGLGGGTQKKTAARPAARASAAKGAESSKSGARGKASAKPKPSAKGRVATKARASSTSGAVSATGAGKGRSGGVVDAPGKKHRKPVPSESGATGAPRGEGSRIAKLKAANQNRVQRRG